MGKKVVTSIRIDQDILRTAKELGLSVSKVSENALKEAIKRLQTPVPQTDTNGGYIDTRKRVSSATVAGPGGIEPPTPGLKARCFRRG